MTIYVSIPIYHATGNMRKSLVMNGIVLAAVAGIMVYISLDELLPTAEKFGEHHISISGLIAGMMVMALSLFLLTRIFIFNFPP